jgi:hypothetical protein
MELMDLATGGASAAAKISEEIHRSRHAVGRIRLLVADFAEAGLEDVTTCGEVAGRLQLA